MSSPWLRLKNQKIINHFGKHFFLELTKARTLPLFFTIFSGKNWKCPGLGAYSLAELSQNFVIFMTQISELFAFISQHKLITEIDKLFADEEIWLIWSRSITCEIKKWNLKLKSYGAPRISPTQKFSISKRSFSLNLFLQYDKNNSLIILKSLYCPNKQSMRVWSNNEETFTSISKASLRARISLNDKKFFFHCRKTFKFQINPKKLKINKNRSVETFSLEKLNKTFACRKSDLDAAHHKNCLPLHHAHITPHVLT